MSVRSVAPCLLVAALVASTARGLSGSEGWYEISAEEVPASEFFSPEEISAAKRYSHTRLAIWGLFVVLELAFWSTLLFGGIGRRVVAFSNRMTRTRLFLSAIVFTLTVLLVRQVVIYPLALISHFHRVESGLSIQSLGSWHVDRLLIVGGNALLTITVVSVALVVIRRAPRRWWMWASGAACALVVGGMYVYPLWITPLFNEFRLLDPGRLRDEIVALADRCDVDVDDIYVMDASRRSTHSNAYFAGVGSSRRIVLYDTLIENHSVDEVVSVLAHEIGHWRRHHIWKGMSLAMLGAVLMIVLFDRVLACWSRRRWCGVDSKWSVAAIPLFFLFAFVAQLLTMPIQNAVSRQFEREADDEELRLTGRPELLISGMQKMARTNRSDVEPHPFKEWLLHSHPSTMNRIRRAVVEQRRQGATTPAGDSDEP